MILPTDPEFEQTGLLKESRVRLDRIVTLDRSLVRRRLGRIGPATALRVNAALRHTLDL